VKILVTLVKSSLVFVLVEGWRLPPFIFIWFPLIRAGGDCHPSFFYGSLEERVAIATLHFYAIFI
jgi:hypothetical protein